MNIQNIDFKNKKVIIGIISLILIVFFVIIIFIIIHKGKDKPSELLPSDIQIAKTFSSMGEYGVPKFLSGDLSERKIENYEDVLSLLESLKDDFKIKDPRNEFKKEKETKNNGINYYRLQQVYSDLEVYGHNLIIAVKDKKVINISGYYIPNITKEINTTISDVEAQLIVNNYLGVSQSVQNIKKVIYEYNQNIYIAYVVNLFVNNDNVEVVVDAETGRVINSGSKVLDITYTGRGLEDRDYIIDIDNNNDLFDRTRKISVRDFRGYELNYSDIEKSHPIYKVDDNMKYSLFQKSSITAMSHIENVYDFYKNTLGRNSFDNNGSSIVVNVWVDNWANACWVPDANQMYIGKKSDIYYAQALDVLAHEFTHGVVLSEVNLNLTSTKSNTANETCAISEGLADIFAAIIEGNWTIGESIETMRNIEKPMPDSKLEKWLNGNNSIKNLVGPIEKGGDYYYPDYYIKNHLESEIINRLNTNNEDATNKSYQKLSDWDSGGCHINSQVISHIAYLMNQENVVSSLSELAKIWYDAIYFLPNSADFEDMANAVLQSIQNSNMSNESVYKALQIFEKAKILNKTYTISSKIPISENEIHLKIYDALTNELLADMADENSSKTLPIGVYNIVIHKEGYEDYTERLFLYKDVYIDFGITEKNEEHPVDIKNISEIQNYKMEIDMTTNISGAVVNSDFKGIIDEKNQTGYLESNTKTIGIPVYTQIYCDFKNGNTYSKISMDNKLDEAGNVAVIDPSQWQKSQNTTQKVDLVNILNKLNSLNNVTQVEEGHYKVVMSPKELSGLMIDNAEIQISSDVEVDVYVESGYINRIEYDFSNITSLVQKLKATIVFSNYNEAGDIIIPKDLLDSVK